MNIKILIIVILSGIAFERSLAIFFRSDNVDFYHLWGVSAALKLAEHRLGNPYRETEKYADALNDHAQKHGPYDQKLRDVNQLRRNLFPAVSPLLYAAFSFFPVDYSVSSGIFKGIQILLFLLAFVFLGALYRYDKFLLLCLSLVLLIFFRPLAIDIAVGNINSVQFFTLAALIGSLEYFQGERKFRHAVTASVLFLTGLSFIVLLKPNVFLIALLMAIHLWTRYGSRTFLTSFVLSAALSVPFVIIPCLYFRSGSVWFDFYTMIYGGNKTAMVFPVHLGNYSAILIISQWLHISIFSLAALVAVFLLASILLMVFLKIRTDPMEKRVVSLRNFFVQIFRNLNLVTGIGIAGTFAISPLVWFHYYVLTLIPALWLINTSPRLNPAALLCIGSVVMSSGMLRIFFDLLKLSDIAPVAVALSWIPLWCAMLIQVWSIRPPRGHVPVHSGQA